MNLNKRKEVLVRNNPGIYKILKWDEDAQRWIETGKYRAIKRIVEDGRSRKEQAVFSHLEEAKAFRFGTTAHKHVAVSSEPKYTFADLVKEWMPFHFLTLEKSTQQTYEKVLPHLDYLSSKAVSEINTSAIDDLIRYWVKEFPKTKRRENFEKELKLLGVVLNFYRKRKDPRYLMPILPEHFHAADIAKKAKRAVRSLSQEQLGRFLAELKALNNPIYYPLALTQFCLGLRIGEALGLAWDSLDLPGRIARIEQTIEWDYWTWQARIKERPKNGRERVLVIPETLAAELERLCAIRDPRVALVFHKHGQPLNRKTIGTTYNIVLKRLGYAHVSGTHMLRKTSATQANRMTGDFYAVSKLLDHSSPQVTLRYVEEVTESKRKIANALNEVLTNGQCGTDLSRKSPQTRTAKI